MCIDYLRVKNEMLGWRDGSAVAFAEDPGSIPSNHICDSNCRESDALFWPLGAQTHTQCNHMQANTLTWKIK